jgi:fructokinase
MRLGVDLGGTKTEIVALGDDGREALRRRVATPRDDYPATVATVARLVAAAEAEVGRAASVGVGTPGSVIPETGLMKNCNSTWLNDRPLPADLADACGRPVAVANDADCFALSEATDGAGAGAPTVFGVILGTGVGGGLVVGGRALQGPNGLVGEWGHVRVGALDRAPEPVRRRFAALPSRPCWCGATDCVETWLSGPGLARTGHALGGPASDDASALVTAAGAGDATAAAALDLYAWLLAASLATVIDVVDPACIVLGGGVSNAPNLYTLVPERWTRFVFSDRVRTPLRAARHGDSGGVRGAARLDATGEGPGPSTTT